MTIVLKIVIYPKWYALVVVALISLFYGLAFSYVAALILIKISICLEIFKWLSNESEKTFFTVNWLKGEAQIGYWAD